MNSSGCRITQRLCLEPLQKQRIFGTYNSKYELTTVGYKESKPYTPAINFHYKMAHLRILSNLNLFGSTGSSLPAHEST